MKNETKQLLRQLGWASTIGIEMVVAVFVGLAFGIGLDRWLGTSPWLTLLFLMMGIIAGFVNYFRFARKQRENEDTDEF